MIAEIEALLARKRESVQILAVELRALKRVAFLRPSAGLPPASPMQSFALPQSPAARDPGPPPARPYVPPSTRGTLPTDVRRDNPPPPAFSYQPPQVAVRGSPPAGTGAVRGAAPVETPPEPPEQAPAPAAPFRSLRGGAPIQRGRGPDSSTR